MQFKTLEEKCKFYRELTDYRLMPKSYVIVSLDGRSFSNFVKKQFDLPFDDKFIHFMNETTKYVCNNVSNCKFAYTQSDEMSLVLSDIGDNDTDTFFSNRLCKLQSIIASLATGKFNQLMMIDLLLTIDDEYEKMDAIANQRLVQFDCRAWNVPDDNELYCYFLWRQNDCIRNSKLQVAQIYLDKKVVYNKTTDDLVQILKEEKDIDWHMYPSDKKYGRMLYKEPETLISKLTGETLYRNRWTVHDAFCLNNVNNKDKFLNIVKSKPKRLEV